jgi:hypothetical protein
MEFLAPQPLQEHARDDNRFLVSRGPYLSKERSTVISRAGRGDVIFFDPLTPHCTHRDYTMARHRVSLDLRFF